MIASERLYLTADGEIVRHGDVRAVSLLAAAGQPLPAGTAVPSFDVPEPESKSVEAPPNKAVRSAPNKRG